MVMNVMMWNESLGNRWYPYLMQQVPNGFDASVNNFQRHQENCFCSRQHRLMHIRSATQCSTNMIVWDVRCSCAVLTISCPCTPGLLFNGEWFTSARFPLDCPQHQDERVLEKIMLTNGILVCDCIDLKSRGNYPHPFYKMLTFDPKNVPCFDNSKVVRLPSSDLVMIHSWLFNKIRIGHSWNDSKCYCGSAGHGLGIVVICLFVRILSKKSTGLVQLIDIWPDQLRRLFEI